MSANSTAAAMSDTSDFEINLYHYIPSLAGSIIFVVLFAAVSAGHGYFSYRYRAWFFIPAIVGALFELAGYCARTAAHSNLTSISIYVVQTLLLLLPPILFAATIYMTLSRIVRGLHAEKLALIPIGWLTKTFVTSDVICFFVQAIGGVLQAINPTSSLADVGKAVVIAGLVLQVVIFGVFVVTSALFHRRVRRTPTPAALDGEMAWEATMLVLYATSFCITLRNVVRIVEYVQGFDGWVISHQVMLFVFDALPMFALLAMLLVWYPPRLLAVDLPLQSAGAGEAKFKDPRSDSEVESGAPDGTQER